MLRIVRISLGILLCVGNAVLGEVSGFRETFSGEGPYSPPFGGPTGFEEPNWNWFGDGQFDGNGAYRIENVGYVGGGSKDLLGYPLQGIGSFRTTVQMHDFDLGTSYDDVVETYGSIAIYVERFSLTVLRQEYLVTPEVLVFGRAPWRGISFPLGDTRRIDLHDDLTLEIVYNDDFNEAVLSLSTGETHLRFGPLPAEMDKEESSFLLEIEGWWDGARGNASIDLIEVVPISFVLGDATTDEIVNADDIDRWAEAIREASQNLAYDLNSDSIVTASDRTVLIQNILNTYFGDSNLDGEFNSADLVNVFVAGEYEDAIGGNSTWATGDWSGNGEFDSADLVLAFQDGGYELGPRAAVNNVPEPNGLALPSMFLFAFGWLLRRRQR